MWVKVCGVTRLENALEVAGIRPNGIGLNFYKKSKRATDTATAKRIVAALPPEILPVGLFVNHSTDDIRRICDATGISTIQLHGDEKPSMVVNLGGLRIIRAIRVDNETVGGLRDEISSWLDARADLFGILLDARIDGTYGGTGHTAPWKLIADTYEREHWPPLILAGGLTPENVAAAIQDVTPWGIDVASGVESSPGIKSPDLVRRFLTATLDPQR